MTYRALVSSSRRILLRAPNWIGDAVMSEPALAAVRSLFPQAHLTLLARPAIAELFKDHRAVDHLVVYEYRSRHVGLSGKWALAMELKRHRFDLAILFQNAFEAALLALLAGIPRRYGYKTDGRAWLLTHAVPLPPGAAVEHHTRYYQNLLRPLGAPEAVRAPQLSVSPQEDEDIGRRLVDWGFDPSEPLIGLNPGSTYGGAKRWPPERFAQTADRLVRLQGGRVVIVGAGGEEPLSQAIAERMSTRPLVLTGRTTIRELMAIIRRCRLFLTNDTGPMHVAAALGVPVVAVFGPTDPRTTAPLGARSTIMREAVECSPCLLRECPIDHRCMQRLTVDRVYEAAIALLEEDGASEPAAGQDPSRAETPLKGVTVFLDRDGTVNRDTGYVRTLEEVGLLPGVIEGLRRLRQTGARLVLITNQSGIARGILTQEALHLIHDGLCRRLQAEGVMVDAIYYCPHHPDDGCTCRKPQIGMIDRAVADLGIDLSRAYLVGDKAHDVELARRAGTRSILVTTGPNSREALALLQRSGTPPDYVASALDEAADWILHDVKARRSPTGARSRVG